MNLLGLDIPTLPEVSLAGITTDGVLLYWKPPDNPHPSLTHAIHVNGIKGKSCPQDLTQYIPNGARRGGVWPRRYINSGDLLEDRPYL